MADQTPGATSARGWWVAGGAAVAVLAVVLVSLTLTGDDDEVAPVAIQRTARVPVYFVGDTALGPRLFREVHELDTDHDLQAAVRLALTGTPQDPDYRAALKPGTDLGEVTVHEGSDRITITLPSDALAEEHRADSGMLLLQALAWTATETLGKNLPIAVTLDGKQEGAAQLDGIDLGPPLARQVADDIQAPVQIRTPADGDTVGTRFTVKGVAAAFEGTVEWQLRTLAKHGKRGKVVEKGYATTTECCTLAAYEFEIGAEPGRYTLAVSDTDVSDGEGHGVSTDTKTLVVK